MKNKIARSILLANAFLLVTGLLVFADEQYIRFTVPFSFSVMNKNFPAGTYTIRQSDETSGEAYTITSADGRISEMFLTETSQQMKTPGKTELIFDQVGNKYFLAKFFDAGEGLGRQLMKSDNELSAEAMTKVQTQKIIAADIVRSDTSSAKNRHHR